MRISKNKAFNKALLFSIMALAWPTMLQELLQTAVQYIDTAMVGALGTAATASVGATTTINWLVNSTISAIGIGFLAFISQAIGAQDNKSARKASSQAVTVTVISGTVFTALCLLLSPFVPAWMQVDESIRPMAATYFFILYSPMLFRAAIIVFGTVLRAVGDTKTPMLVGALVNVINVILNFVFIYPTRVISILGSKITVFGMGWGVAGAASASAIAFFAGGIVITVAFWRHPVVSPKGKSFKPDPNVLKPCFRIAVPNALQRFGTCLGYVAFAAMVNSLGEISTAAHTIANTVESAFYIPGYGMQAAAATLAGNALGAKDNDRIKALGRMLLLIEVVLMILSGGLLFIFAPQMMTLFSSDSAVITLGSIVLRMVAVTEPFFGIYIIIEGMMQGMGKTIMPFVANIIGMWGIRIAGTFICTQVFHMGLVSAWACMILHNLLLCMTFAVYYISGRWNPLNNKKAKDKKQLV